MKKLLPISLVINALLIIAAVTMIFGPVVGNTFSRTSSNLFSAGGAPAPDTYSYDSLPMEAPSAIEPEALILGDQAVSNSGSAVPAAQIERIVIKNADLVIVVSDVDGRMKDIQIMAEQMGGFVVSSNLYQSYTNNSNSVQVPEGQVVIRVPSEKLKEALEKIKNGVIEVQNETVSGQDVTAEYVDLTSRLKNLEAAEAQLDEIMQNATDTTDVVTIFNQLVSYREQIEVVKGQIKYYDEAAALSAITVRVIAAETIQPVVIGKWEPKGAALEAVQDLINFLQNFTEFAIRFVIYILPSWLIVLIPLYLIFLGARALFRRMRRNKVEKEEVQETEVEKK